MKNLILLCTIFMSVYTHAQNYDHFGLKTGLNIAGLKVNNPYSGYSSRSGFHAGGFAHFHLTTHFAVQPELLYSGQGAKVKIDHGNDVSPRYGIVDWKLNYVNLPVMLQYMLIKGLRFETGPQVGLLISAKSKYFLDVYDLKSQFKDLDFSWGFGASYVTKIGLGFNIRYNLGLSNINAYDDAWDYENNMKNMVAQFSLFYQFGKKK